ncbi:MAG: hypothetical protein EXQ84_04990 [Rhodospirillaceae bacterium]|nr:hypothetical protein [Rhodospirillaceae bacterium]
MIESDHPSGPSKPLVAAVKQLLRPLVRMLIAKSVGLPALLALLKEVYVDVALNEFPVEGKKQTDSRVSLLTGVHRKDVKRLRGQAFDALTAPRSIGLGAQVVARWLAGSDTADKSGMPLPLPRTAAKGPSFDGLVAGISTDVRPRAVLDEWLRLGVARLDKEGRVVLNQAAFVPEKGFEEKAFYLGRNIHDHLAAAAHNLLADGNPLLERSVHYSDLTPDTVGALQEAAERSGMQALLSLNRMALELAAKDKGKAEATKRVNFGLYFFKGPSTFNNLQLEDVSISKDRKN